MGHDWDERYAASEQVWSGRVNGALASEVADMAPGRVLDVGCGEGADAIWLAQRGWDVTAIDISTVAVDRARRAAEAAGVTIEWVCADVTTTPPAPAAYDLVTLQYPALPRSDAVIDGLLGAVAPGGTLLITWHVLTDEHVAHLCERGIDPAEYVHVHDVVARLGDGWEIEVNEIRPRVDPPENAKHVEDIVLRTRRIR
ncbi:MAG TPA: class I SAM-dependent methyltransferase [Acidimicrobiales bacterium]